MVNATLKFAWKGIMAGRHDDISLIRKYLNGELDTRAMHRLERSAQEDPFLMDALEGYHIGIDQQGNLEDLKQKLQRRIHRSSRKTMVLWPLIGAAASVIGFAIIGAWWVLVYLPAAHNRASLPGSVQTTSVLKASQLATPDLQKPGKQSGSSASVPGDTTRADSLKKPDTTHKTELALTDRKKAPAAAPQKSHNPISGTVDPSTVIADLNKQPYSIAKHKTGIVNTPQNTASLLVVGKPTQATNGASNAVSSGNKMNTTAVVPASKPSSGQNKTTTLAENIKNNPVIPPSNKTVNPTDIAKLPSAVKIKADTQKSNNQLAETAVKGYAGQKKKDIDIARENASPLSASSNSSFKSTRIEPNAIIKSTELQTVKGQVVASDDGKPIAGAALRIMGTQTGTVTDANGRFSVRMAKNQSLQAIYIGYYGKQVTPNGLDVKILMQPVNATLNEVVVSVPEKNNTADIKASNPKTTVAKMTTTPNNKSAMHVSGRVLAFATNNPVPQVVMWNKNADEQYLLENDGLFDIVVHKGDEIYVGHKGFKIQKVKIKNNTHFDIILEESTSTLFDGFVKGLNFNPYDDTAHPLIGWNKFKPFQQIKSTDGKKGTVKVDFTVNADNSISNIKVSKSVSATADAEAIRIIKEQTKWVHNTNNQPENISVKFKVE